MSNSLLFNTVLIALDTSILSKESIDLAIASMRKIGSMIDQTAIIHKKSFSIISSDDSYNGATMLRTPYTQQQLYTELQRIESKLKKVHLHILTFNNSIVDSSEIIRKPFLIEFIKQLQPELFTWR